MSLEHSIPLCKRCASLTFLKAVTAFTCDICGATLPAIHGGGWHYCGKCARALARCALCGKPDEGLRYIQPLATISTEGQSSKGGADEWERQCRPLVLQVRLENVREG